ncbi:hypothetical protein RIR_jg19134.t1 [Rhizophagus irregularis DAOM 181602=DAOM 197198]|nr:hypothetical protein RIR_jg19134.t1 [Rhizophagus irregularis DAOM 181602=DAOM 197198]
MFSDAICFIPQKYDIAKFNINKLKSLNCSVALIKAIHTGSKEKLVWLIDQWVLSKKSYFKENQPPSLFPIAILIEFVNYFVPAIVTEEGKRLVPVLPIRYSWKGQLFMTISQVCALKYSL